MISSRTTGGNSFRGPEPEHRNLGGRGYGVAVERHDPKGVPGQREAANLRGAAIQDVEEHALAVFHRELARHALTFVIES